MRKGVIYYKDTYNIGDDIQTLAATQLLGNVDEYFDRETLHLYDGEQTDVLMNGYFMAQPKNWPPSDKINPHFISFHISAYKDCEKYMLDDSSVSYYKKNGPIGCRDKETMHRLQAKGVDAFFSSCVTLTLQVDNKNLPDSGEILFVDPFLKMNSDDYTNHMIEKMVPDSLKSKVAIIKHDMPEITSMSLDERLDKAQKLLERYKRASLVFTSRIHCALPCLAIGTPVYFMDVGYDRVNARKRFDGILDMMNVIPQDYFPQASSSKKSKVLRRLGIHTLQKPKDISKIVDWDHAKNKTQIVDERIVKLRSLIGKAFL